MVVKTLGVNPPCIPSSGTAGAGSLETKPGFVRFQQLTSVCPKRPQNVHRRGPVCTCVTGVDDATGLSDLEVGEVSGEIGIEGWQ